jgi:ribosomal protein S18 acetylase RimI-like enzyme
MSESPTIIQAKSEQELTAARELILEYARTLDCDPCLRSIEEDVDHLPGEYAPPEGRLLIAVVDGKAAGCVAFHKVDDKVCELRRLYLRPAYRGRHIGTVLMTAVLDEARKAGYTRARLYTLPSMKEAISLYHRLGFRDIPPYGEHVIPGAYYLERELEPRQRP